MRRFRISEEHLLRAEQTIPLGSQTFSKSRTQYPVGISPLYADRAKGAYLWDIDNNKYVDLVSSLASITLGYGDKRVNNVVSSQLRKAVSMSLPGILEAEVAELICQIVPSAEMVRFGKNGTDATSAAVRLARAYTGRDHVLVCGYHGWQDWYIASTSRNKGIPDSVSSLTHKFNYNDKESITDLFTRYPNQIAAVIMEPMNVEFPKEGYLGFIRELTKTNGAVLIFDETITGFRVAPGGAQELFGVTPDLSTFGKGMANGFPLSAVVGKREIMMEMEEIFFSGTFGGELLSLAAAKYVLQKHLNTDVTNELSKIGANLSSKIENLVSEYKLQKILTFSGHNSWRFLNWAPDMGYEVSELKTLFMQEMFEAGVLILSTHNVTLAHTPKVLNEVEVAYRKALESISLGIEKNTLLSSLKVKPLEPLFKVR